MKKLTLVLLCSGLLSGCITYNRIGDLVMVSNRDLSRSDSFIELERNVTAKSRLGRKDGLENAIDKATGKVRGGECLKNVKIWVKANGKVVKVQGDVWGVKID